MTAAIGMIRTTAARSRSLTIITSRWFQRSTKAPAIGDRRRFGRVAATKTSADGEDRVGQPEHEGGQRDLVDPVAEEADQLAGPQRRERAVEREPDVGVAADAQPDVDARPAGQRDRAAAGVRGRGRGRGTGARASSPAARSRRPHVDDPAVRAEDPPEERPRARAREAGPDAAEDERPIERGRLGQAARETGAGPDPLLPDRRVDPARQPGRAGEPAQDRARRALGLLLRFVVLMPDDRGEEEEREPGRQEHVADRGDVLDERQRDRQDVAERPGVEEEVEVECPVRGSCGTARGRSARRKPAASRLRIQIGMWPALAAIAIVFDRIPTNARRIPGCERLTHRETRSRRKDDGEQRQAERLDDAAAAGSARTPSRSGGSPRSSGARPSGAGPRRGCRSSHRRARPRISPKTMPPISMGGSRTRNSVIVGPSWRGQMRGGLEMDPVGAAGRRFDPRMIVSLRALSL